MAQTACTPIPARTLCPGLPEWRKIAPPLLAALASARPAVGLALGYASPSQSIPGILVASSPEFVPDPNWPSIVELATKLWGPPNPKLSKRDDIRFGTKGSKSVRPSDNTWFDHEANQGGGYLDLAKPGELPPPRHNGNGQAMGEVLPPWKDVGSTYSYTDADGRLILEVVRTISGSPRFRQRMPDPGSRGGWKWSVKHIPNHNCLLYRLPELRNALFDETVWITEGEKDADRLHDAGLTATTNIGGAGKWRDEYAEEFRGRHCVVLADNDPQSKDDKTGKPKFHPDGRPMLTGQDHAADVARSLVGVAASVKVPLLPVPQDGSDVSDFLDAGHTLDELQRLAREAPEHPKGPDHRPEAPVSTPEEAPKAIAFHPDAKVASQLGAQLVRQGASFEEMCELLHTHPKTATWCRDKGEADDKRELHRIWDKARAEEEGWRGGAQRNKDSALLSNLFNAMAALNGELSGVFAYDEMAFSPMLMKPLPGEKATGLPRPIEDCDVTKAQRWLQSQGLVSISNLTAHLAVDACAREHAFHPVRNYLNGLRWDGEDRLQGWLNAYLGADNNAYTSAIGTMFLIQMVKRIYEPGCKADYTPILEDPRQGTAKSTACAILGGAWFSDSLPDIHGDAVRVSQHLRGKWLIEIPELSALEKAHPGQLNAFLTRPIEQFTPKFGRRDVKEPRQCCFIGTTNKQVYLRDPTGARREWPVKTGSIDTDALRRDRDQLFAEAVVRYRRGEQAWPTAEFEAEHMQPEQAERFDADAWEGLAATYLLGRPAATVIGFLTEGDDRGGLGIDKAKITRRDQNRVTDIFQSLDWRRGKRTTVARIWLPPPRPKT